MDENIHILGARSNNLKDVTCTIARNALTVISGVSGSGKSTLAFETLFAEGQRRYVESLSAYARQFLQKMARPEIDAIENLPPAIAIEQRNRVKNARSTVGTITEVHDYLRLLFAKIAEIRCADCGLQVRRDSPRTVVEHLRASHAAGTKLMVIMQASPEEGDLLRERLLRDGMTRVLVHDKKTKTYAVRELEDERVVQEKWAGVVLDRLTLSEENAGRLLESLEAGFLRGHGEVSVFLPDTQQLETFYAGLRCRGCLKTYADLRPVNFSFNNPLGACPECEGFGRAVGLDMDRVIPDPRLSLAAGAIDPFNKPAYKDCYNDLVHACARLKIPMNKPWNQLSAEHQKLVLEGGKKSKKDKWYGVNGFFEWLEGKRYKTHVRIFMARYRGYSTCPACQGRRLNAQSLQAFIRGKNIDDVCRMPVGDVKAWFQGLVFSDEEQAIAKPVIKEISARLGYLVDVGLGYLTLARQARTLSGGESQRIALATALGTSLTDTLYVLDEPSIGLHPRDNDRLMNVLLSLRDLGNTIVVVEHDPGILKKADEILDMGPQAGRYGGQVVFQGNYQQLLNDDQSVTGQYLRRAHLQAPKTRRPPRDWIGVKGARIHNLKGLDVSLPLGVLLGISGVSGAGKSSLVHHVLHAGFQALHGERADHEIASFDRLEGVDKIAAMILMDQSPVGRSARSNPATFMGFYSDIRALFAGTKAARQAGLGPGAFSFNVAGGRCETCCGAGVVTIDMQFLDDVQVVCEACQGKRFSPKVLAIELRDKNITDVLGMTVDEAYDFFVEFTGITRDLQLLKDVGLHYLTLGQSTATLSGGEAQRLKLAAHMGESAHKNNLYLFDEPTTGLHLFDVEKLLACFERLVDMGNTVLVIEHHLELLSRCDWLIDMGPEGGEGGGLVIAQGTPEAVTRVEKSYTGRYLRQYLEDASSPRSALTMQSANR